MEGKTDNLMMTDKSTGSRRDATRKEKGVAFIFGTCLLGAEEHDEKENKKKEDKNTPFFSSAEGM